MAKIICTEEECECFAEFFRQHPEMDVNNELKIIRKREPRDFKAKRIIKKIIIQFATFALLFSLGYGIKVGVNKFISWANEEAYKTPVDLTWNNGVCNDCNTAWHYKETVGHRNGSTYIYECECGEHHIESHFLH